MLRRSALSAPALRFAPARRRFAPHAPWDLCGTAERRHLASTPTIAASGVPPGRALSEKRPSVVREKEWLDFLQEADLNHDGKVSQDEWFQFLKRKSLEVADLQGITVGFPIPPSLAQTVLAQSGMHLSINGFDYELQLIPVGETRANIDAKLARMAELGQEIEALEQIKAPMDKKAAAHAGRVMKSIFAYLFLQVGVVVKLTFFSRFGWDVMEPITYLLTFSTSLFGLAYFTWNKLEFTYPALAGQLAKRRALRLYEKNGFDYARFLHLQSERAEIKRALDMMVPPRRTPL